MALYSSQFGDVFGLGTARETYENAFGWGRKESGLITGFVIDGSARDAGSANTAVLRPGLVLGALSATSKLKEYSGTATDGTQVAVAVLLEELRMTDLITGSNSDKLFGCLVGGPVQASKLYGLDQKARADMWGRFVFDDDYAGNSSGWRDVVAKTADYTVVAGDNNRIFTNQGAAGAVVFTLPAIAKGLRFRFYAEASQNVTITAATADTMVTFNDAAADSIALSTANKIIGGGWEIYANANASKWLVFPFQWFDGTNHTTHTIST